MHYLPEDTFTEDDTIKFIKKHSCDNPEAYPVVLLETNEVIGHIIFEQYFGKHTYEISTKCFMAMVMPQKLREQ